NTAHALGDASFLTSGLFLSVHNLEGTEGRIEVLLRPPARGGDVRDALVLVGVLRHLRIFLGCRVGLDPFLRPDSSTLRNDHKGHQCCLSLVHTDDAVIMTKLSIKTNPAR